MIPENLDPDLIKWADRNSSSKWTAEQLVSAWLTEGYDNMVPSNNWRPGKPPTARKSVEHVMKSNVKSSLNTIVKRSDFDLDDLAELRNLRTEVDDALQAAVDTMKTRGHSWTEVAKALGVTRSYAIRKYGHREDAAS